MEPSRALQPARHQGAIVPRRWVSRDGVDEGDCRFGVWAVGRRSAVGADGEGRVDSDRSVHGAPHPRQVGLRLVPGLGERRAASGGEPGPFGEDPHAGHGLVDAVHGEQELFVGSGVLGAGPVEQPGGVVLPLQPRSTARERRHSRGLVHEDQLGILEEHARHFASHARLVDVPDDAKERVRRDRRVQRLGRREPLLRDLAARRQPSPDVGRETHAPGGELSRPVLPAVADASLKSHLLVEGGEHRGPDALVADADVEGVEVGLDVSQAVDHDVVARRRHRAPARARASQCARAGWVVHEKVSSPRTKTRGWNGGTRGSI